MVDKQHTPWTVPADKWEAEEDIDYGEPTGKGRVFHGATEMSARDLPMKDVYLIAAAPEMLDALRDAHALICRTLCDEAAGHHREECTSALVAIAKAEHRCAACGAPPEGDRELCTECLDMEWETPERCNMGDGFTCALWQGHEGGCQPRPVKAEGRQP